MGDPFAAPALTGSASNLNMISQGILGTLDTCKWYLVVATDRASPCRFSSNHCSDCRLEVLRACPGIHGTGEARSCCTERVVRQPSLPRTVRAWSPLWDQALSINSNESLIWMSSVWYRQPETFTT